MYIIDMIYCYIIHYVKTIWYILYHCWYSSYLNSTKSTLLHCKWRGFKLWRNGVPTWCKHVIKKHNATIWPNGNLGASKSLHNAPFCVEKCTDAFHIKQVCWHVGLEKHPYPNCGETLNIGQSTWHASRWWSWDSCELLPCSIAPQK